MCKIRAIICFVVATLFITVFLISCSEAGNSGSGGGGTPSLPLAPKYVDDFEDNSKNNPINFWMCTSAPPQATVNTFEIVSTPPGIGNYALKLDADISAATEISQGNYYGNLPMHTGATGSATPMDGTDYNRIAFSISFEETTALTPGASIEVTLRLNGGSGSVISYDLLNDFQSTFTEYTIPLTDFTVNAGSLSDVIASIKQISYTFVIRGDENDSVGFTFILDELRFEE